MANPSPQHTPTDGLGVAAYVHVTGTGVTTSNSAIGTSDNYKPNGNPYSLTLSVSAAGGHAATCQLTASLVDVSNTAYSPTGSFVYHSDNNPSSGSPSWYRPSVGSAGGSQAYSGDVASISSSGLITALNPGMAKIFIYFPTFDNTLGNMTGNYPVPQESIFAAINVQVIP